MKGHERNIYHPHTFLFPPRFAREIMSGQAYKNCQLIK
jgi:hypothetical protein